MSWLAEHAFSERSLGIAWKKVQKRESDDGNLAPSILKFQEDAEEKILRLSEALLDGNYKPYQFTEVDIETNSKERTLHIPQYKTALSPAQYSPQPPPALIHRSARPRLDTARD